MPAKPQSKKPGKLTQQKAGADHAGRDPVADASSSSGDLLLKIYSIEELIRKATGQQDDLNVLSQLLERDRCRRAKSRAPQLASPRTHTPGVADQPSRVPYPNNPALLHHKFTQLQPTRLILESDQDLAALIKQAPSALVLSAEVQDAIARWTYAARFFYDPETRGKAKQLLETSIPVKVGNPGRGPVDEQKLLSAYDDLRALIEKVLERAAQLRKPVPRIERTEKTKALISTLGEEFWGIQLLYPHGLNLANVMAGDFSNPYASDVAASFIGNIAGMSKSRVMALVTEARKKSARPSGPTD